MPDAATTLRYSLGALTFVSFVLLVLTGLWLAQFYNPSPTGAHDSVLYIIARAPFGDIARSVHVWAASVMVVSIVAHVAWVFYRRSYRRPRELTWYAGVGLAALVFLMVVTGTMLRYDQEGYEAMAHFVAGGQLTGSLGRFFTGAFTASTPLLSRVFSLHTSLVPLLIVGLIGVHFWLIRVLGISAEDSATTPFADHLPRLLGAGLLLFAGILALAVLAPQGLGYPPVPGHEVTKPFWPLLWIYALESLLGVAALVWAPLAVFTFLLAVPVLDRAKTSGRGVAVLRAAGLVLIIGLVALGAWAALTPPRQHLGM